MYAYLMISIASTRSSALHDATACTLVWQPGSCMYAVARILHVCCSYNNDLLASCMKATGVLLLVKRLNPLLYMLLLQAVQ